MLVIAFQFSLNVSIRTQTACKKDFSVVGIDKDWGKNENRHERVCQCGYMWQLQWYRSNGKSGQGLGVDVCVL